MSFSGFRLYSGRRKTPDHAAWRAVARRSVREAMRSVEEYSIYELDARGRIATWNSGAESQMGYRASEVMGRHFGQLFCAEEGRVSEAERSLSSAAAEGRFSGELWLRRKDGTQFWARMVVTRLSHSVRRAAGYLVITHDLTDLRRREETVRFTLDSDEQAVIRTDAHQCVTFMNTAAERTTDWSSERAIGKPLKEVLRIVDRHGRPCNFDPRQWSSRGAAAERREFNSMLVSRHGKSYDVDVSVFAMPDTTGRHGEALVVYSDRTKHRRFHRELVRAEMHDRLTGLPNRAAFEARLDQALHQHVDHGRVHTLCMIDLHGFGMINEADGSLAGDTLLRQVSRLLVHELRDTDQLARLGADEFGVLLYDCRLHQAQKICARLLQEIRALEFAWGDHVYDLGASFGLTEFADRTRSVSDLMSEAGIARSSAKAAGRNLIFTYTPGVGDAARQHSALRIASSIKSAVKANRFRLYGQEIRALPASGDARPHVEVLVRMVDEAGQLVMPGAFIPAAERNNLMVDIDQWVIGAVIRDIGPTVADLPNVMLSINLSANSLSDPSMVSFMQDLLDGSALPPERLCFEVTETAFVTNLKQAMELIEFLRSRGCSVMLDDFGAGVSSFGYLKQFPVDYIKIDGHFVRDIVNSNVDRAIVESIHEISGKLGARTIAEFVESPAILGVLNEIGIDYAQGYAIGRPMPFADLLQTLRGGQA
ncbi:EAL domain-containing protein [Paraburkholderia sp. A1RI_3L]|uniref:EAL domain-containing protein n=1 Tax=Paraburkholderia TaxID=1822464 RepID=UPI003B7C74F0